MVTQIVNSVKNTVTAGTDLSTNATGQLVLSGVDTASNPFAPIDAFALSGTGNTITKYLNKRVKVATISYTVPTVKKELSFMIRQYIDGNYETAIIFYESDGTATDLQIATGMVAQINASKLKVTATGSATPITITADAGYPMFEIIGEVNVTEANAMATFAPNVTATDAITNVIAPNVIAATAIAGTSVVTVTTAAAHGLLPGDTVTIASAATFLMTYIDSNGVSRSAATGVTCKVATVPTSTTFTLEGVGGNGATNSGTITITANSVCFVVPASAAASIIEGDLLAIAGVATATLNGGAGGTFRVGQQVTTTRFRLEEAALVGTNSGTITITRVPTFEVGTGTALANIGGAVSTDKYNVATLAVNQTIQPDYDGVSRRVPYIQNVYILSTQTAANDLLYRFEKVVDNYKTSLSKVALV